MNEDWDDEEAEDSRNGMFAIMWDCHGLEAVAKVPDPADHTFAVLANQPKPAMPNINMWELRARFNPQRHYEIYLITTTPGISENDIRDMFEADPQSAADTIRRIGNKFYSDRNQENRIVIR
jgi:hypothetical protein